MIGITAVMTATPGQGEALVAAMNKVAAEVVKEAGNHCYLVHQSVDDADTLMIYEQYSDEAALQAHREHMKELGGGLKGLLAGRPEVTLYTLKD